MGEVYLARDSRLGRSVAIKILPASASSDADSVRRFVQEAKSASSLNHPNIVTIHDIGQHESTRFIVMEHVDGVPLTAITGEPMPLDRFFEVALQITAAFAAAHGAGIIHRDIKPANVMVSHSGRVKVVDFGLARLTTPTTSEASDAPTANWAEPQTSPGAIVGTVGYMSPEQVQGQPVDTRSDVFSLGVLFHELLTGRRAFAAGSPLETLAAILRDELPSVATSRNDVPPALAAVIARCVAKRPDQRFNNGSELHGALEEARRSVQTAPVEAPARRRILIPVAVTLLLLVAVSVAAFLWRRESRLRWVRSTAIPEIERLTKQDEIDAAYRLARRALDVAPDDPQLQQAWTNISLPISITSQPSGADVSVKGFRSKDDWIPLGRTPIKAALLPLTLLRFQVKHDGYVGIELAPEATSFDVRLHPPDQSPPRMVFVAGGPAAFRDANVAIPDFWIDTYEVTNREFKRFLDAGGYRRKEFWKHPVVKDGRTLTQEEAVAEFVDATGRPGPAGWELGSYAETLDEHPVEGVSWYEAAAYASFAGKSLPTVFHWSRVVGEPGIFSDILAMSNFAGRSSVRVGSLGGISTYGTHDMAGNVKEWAFNTAGDRRYILGGSWLDPSYKYLEHDAQLPMARDRGFGFRLIREGTPPPPAAAADISVAKQKVPEPVDDATYRTYARLYDYDAMPLNATTDEVDDSHASWRREKVSFDAAYSSERVPAYVFIPKNARPPYQTIVFFPGSDAVETASSRRLWLQWVDFFMKSGRVVIYPIYKGTYERRVTGPLGPVASRDLRVQRVKDVRRTLDYIASRADLDPQRVAYYGLSLGANYGAVALAIEPRFKTAVLLAGGLHYSPRTLPEGQRQNFLPRVTLPVLVVNGRDDFTAPYEQSQRPMFELLGTPAANKRHVVLDGGHLPADYTRGVREILGWTDRWLGPVETAGN
jgi:serine/threonine protein kinase/dienelactone hydrolase